MQNTATKNMEQALIYPQAPSGEEEHVNGILGNIEKHLGFIPDGLRLFSISPPLLETFVGNIGYFNMGGTQLPPTLTAMIRYQVSWNAECSYCIELNEGFLSNLGVSLDEVRASRNNPEAAPLSEKEKLLLMLAIKSVNTPDEVNQADMDKVKKQGWGDREIFDAIVQAAYNRAFNYVLKTFNVEHQGTFS